MNSKIVAVLSAAVITVAAVGWGAYAYNINNMENSNQYSMKLATEKVRGVIAQSVVEKINEENNRSEIYNRNEKNNPIIKSYNHMIDIMRENGFDDAAAYMREGNYEAMTDYMNNISLEDYDNMVDIMNKNGFGSMGRMMESVGREGMVQMHNSMSDRYNKR